MGHEVVGVFDGGTVWPEGYATQFAEEHAIGRVYNDLAEMAQDVDVATIHSCNWEIHLSRAEPFVDAGKGVLIDKPLVGNCADAARLLRWETEGKRVWGGSSLRWSQEIVELHASLAEAGDHVHTAFAGCAVDDFNYGIHAYGLLSAIMGPGATKVRFLGTARQNHIQVDWADGKMGLLAVGAQSGYLPFYATVVSDGGVKHTEIDATRVYRALLERSLPYLGGATSSAPMCMRDLLEPELMALAALRSRQQDGLTICLDELDPAGPSYDGSVFADSYATMRRSGTENFVVYRDSRVGGK